MSKELKALEEPKVNNSINLSMNTSDLIDLYIEENSERIKAEINLELNKLNAIRDFDNWFENKEIDNYILKHFKKKLPFTAIKVNVYFTTDYSTCERVNYTAYSINAERIFEILDRRNRVEKYENCYSIYPLSLDRVEISNKKSSLRLCLDDIPNAIKEKVEANIPTVAQRIERFKQRNVIKDRLIVLFEEYRDLNNTRKVKAAFTKKALLQTKEGAKMVEFLKNIESIKQLG